MENTTQVPWAYFLCNKHSYARIAVTILRPAAPKIMTYTELLWLS